MHLNLASNPFTTWFVSTLVDALPGSHTSFLWLAVCLSNYVQRDFDLHPTYLTPPPETKHPRKGTRLILSSELWISLAGHATHQNHDYARVKMTFDLLDNGVMLFVSHFVNHESHVATSPERPEGIKNVT